MPALVRALLHDQTSHEGPKKKLRRSLAPICFHFVNPPVHNAAPTRRRPNRTSAIFAILPLPLGNHSCSSLDVVCLPKCCLSAGLQVLALPKRLTNCSPGCVGAISECASTSSCMSELLHPACCQPFHLLGARQENAGLSSRVLSASKGICTYACVLVLPRNHCEMRCVQISKLQSAQANIPVANHLARSTTQSSPRPKFCSAVPMCSSGSKFNAHLAEALRPCLFEGVQKASQLAGIRK